MPSDAERRAAFKAAKEMILSLVPGMFASFVTDSKLWEVVDAALWAAEAARDKELASKNKTEGEK
jgi:hypothetical protein